MVESVAVLAEAGSDLCRGQMLEARLVGDITAEPEAYLEMARLKTGALFRAVCQIGALLAGADSEQAAALGRYGSDLGVAFQIRDDLILFADPEDSDKPTGSDLANGRPTLPVLMAYQTVRRGHPAGDGRGAGPPLGRARRVRRVPVAADGHRRPAGLPGPRQRVRPPCPGRAGRAAPSRSVDLLTGIVQWAVTTRP